MWPAAAKAGIYFQWLGGTSGTRALPYFLPSSFWALPYFYTLRFCAHPYACILPKFWALPYSDGLFILAPFILALLVCEAWVLGLASKP